MSGGFLFAIIGGMRSFFAALFLLPLTACAVTVSDIARMSRAETVDAPACTITGVVTCVLAWQLNSFTLADLSDPDGAAVYVGGEIPGCTPAEVVGGLPIEAGDVVCVRGRIMGLMLEPGIAATQIEVTARRALPAPPARRVADLMTGRFNNRRVSVSGILRSARVAGTPKKPVTELSLGTPDGVIRVHVRGSWPGLAAYRDAELAVDGVCVPGFNSRAEFLRAEVEAFSRAAVRVVAARQPVRAVPHSPGRSLGVRAWTPDGLDGHLRKLRGEVTYVSAAPRFFVLQAETAVRVNLLEGDLPRVGDLVEAEGFPTVSDDCGVLDDGAFRPLGRTEGPRRPEPLSEAMVADFLARGESGEFDCHYRLVKLAGRVLDVDELPDGKAQLTLAVGENRLAALLPAGSGAPPSELADNPPVVVSGVLKVLYENNLASGRGLRLEGFTVLLRGPDDLVVLSDAASARRRAARLATRAGRWALLPLAALAFWMRARAVRLRERTKAVAADRKRMAEELHDTIAQYLSGARLLLYSVQGEAHALPEAARGAVAMAGDILETARRELRDKILNLQSDELMLRPIARLLKGVAARANAASGAKVHAVLRGLPADMSAQTKNDVLAMVQEAVSNAVKHGRARRIAIVSDPLPGGGFALSVLNDGAPFDASAALGPETGHFGLSSLRERAARNGFTLTFGERKGWTEVRIERRG